MILRWQIVETRWVAEREGAAVSDDGRLTLEHVLADDAWAWRHVLQYGPQAEVLSPPEMRSMVTERAREMIALH